MNPENLKAELEHDRREYPRLEVALPIKAVLPDGKTINVWMRNVSRAGIQLRLDRHRAERLFPDGRITPGSSMTLRLSLPSGEDTWPEIEVSTSVIYAQRIAQDAYLLGVEYVELDHDDYQKLATFIETSLNPGW